MAHHAFENNWTWFSAGKYGSVKLRTPETCRSFNITVELQNQRPRSIVLKLYFSEPDIFTGIYQGTFESQYIYRGAILMYMLCILLRSKLTTNIFMSSLLRNEKQ